MGCLACTYNDIDEGGDEGCPISTPVSICQKCSNEGSDVTNPIPVAHISCRPRVALMHYRGEVHDQIGGAPIKTQIGEHLICCFTSPSKIQFHIQYNSVDTRLLGPLRIFFPSFGIAFKYYTQLSSHFVHLQ